MSRDERMELKTDFAVVLDALPGLVWTTRADGRSDFGLRKGLATTDRSSVLNQSNPTEGSTPLRPPRSFRTEFRPFSGSPTVPNMGEQSEAFMRTRYLGNIAFWNLIQPGSGIKEHSMGGADPLACAAL